MYKPGQSAMSMNEWKIALSLAQKSLESMNPDKRQKVKDAMNKIDSEESLHLGLRGAVFTLIGNMVLQESVDLEIVRIFHHWHSATEVEKYLLMTMIRMDAELVSWRSKW